MASSGLRSRRVIRPLLSLLLSLLTPNVTVCLLGGRTLGVHYVLGRSKLKSLYAATSCSVDSWVMSSTMSVRLRSYRRRVSLFGYPVRWCRATIAQMCPNADITNKAGLICSRIYQVTRIQCELSGRRDSGTALAVVLDYTRSGYVFGHVVVAFGFRVVRQAASS
jgi:hypothetical protein